MATSAVWMKVDEQTFAQKVRDVCSALPAADGEVVLDFAGVRRIGTDGLKAMEHLARTAADKKRRVVLRGVNVDVYKVLKVAKLASGFVFLNS